MRIPNVAFTINLPYMNVDGTESFIKGCDPVLSQDDITGYAPHIPDEFWTHTRYQEVYELPAVNKQPLRYCKNTDSFYHDYHDEHETTGNIFNPFTFLSYFEKLRWSHEGQFIYSSTTGKPICFDRPYCTFKRAWDTLHDAGIAYTSTSELIHAVEEFTGFSFIDAEVFAYHFLHMAPLPWPHEFGALDNSWI
ncbi:hypothetical protein V5O48_019292 [Marasmius crinis-equi]|uniref:Uncharacterized protein n=1 Tax=Marasmius crinis-equi TaxID=585013 RepID=A0ABR3EIW5_9AGAR